MKTETKRTRGRFDSQAERPYWTSPEPGMYTGMLSGRIIGHVVVAEGGYIAFDREPATLGWFATLSEAQEAAAGSA